MRHGKSSGHKAFGGHNGTSPTKATPTNKIAGTADADALLGTDADDFITGLASDDTLSGGPGRDFLSGGDGNDILTGGAGADRLSGGAGADTFVYTAVSDSAIGAADQIKGFDGTSGDLIDLSAIDANETLDGDQAFVWSDAAPVDDSVGAGVVWFASGYLYASTDADAAAEIAIHIGGCHGTTIAVTADYLIL